MKTMCLQTNKYHGLLDKINDLINQERVLELLRDKYVQSDGLVGQKIQYDTWGGFSPRWFNNFYLVE